MFCYYVKRKKGDVICVFASPVRALSVKVLKREEPNKVQLLLTFMAFSHVYYKIVIFDQGELAGCHMEKFSQCFCLRF